MGTTSRQQHGTRARRKALKMRHDDSFRLFLKELTLSGLNPDLTMTPLYTRKRGARRPIVGYRVFILRRALAPGERHGHWSYKITAGLLGTNPKSWPAGINNSFPVEYDQPYIAMGIREGKYKVWGGEGIKFPERHFDDINDAISYASEVIREEEWF
jgi:hypothetical protein